jgi:hypothetical protein
MLEDPEVGHMLYDQYGHIGMVTEVEYIAEIDIHIIALEWYIEGEIYREYYRVGRNKKGDELDFLRLSYYREMRERYHLLKQGAL